MTTTIVFFLLEAEKEENATTSPAFQDFLIITVSV